MVDRQGLERDWRRRAFAGLTMVAGAMVTVGGLYWQAPDQPDPAPPQSVIVGFAEFLPATGRAGPATPAASPESAVPASSPDPAVPASSADPAPYGVATRLVIAYLYVDLPVVSGAIEVAGNPDAYPLCDVAQYLAGYGQPGVPGTVYLYAHARKGMLAPLLEASQVDNGAELLGQQVMVYTGDGWLLGYRIFVVKRHATDFSLANEIAPDEERLVLQTSEGPNGTVPKLQIAAQPIWRQKVPLSQALPSPEPRVCAPST